ncbi:hypothetical protein EJ03DRAFT_327639 [Teratosphaeria nubilosa]|uniref:DUF4048 domain-containing protein n=1 Tax=Teratosphaeria nubilosa TaxID=161662 RepID=A0A6G1L8M7_9PEZI|nr:hypothetical protein EJ03DRAFT_327639 [Teratosphaeria nubilosa]
MSANSRVQHTGVPRNSTEPDTTAATMPVEHVAEFPSPTRSVTSEQSGRTSLRDHARTMSSATESTASTARTSRISFSFPVQPAISGSPTRATHSPVRETSNAAPPETPHGPANTNFLTAVATQERLVLELKEELHKAELHLRELKEQWARHEASKKKGDARRVRKLDPLQTDVLQRAEARDIDADSSSALVQQESERRKALLNGGKSEGKSRTKFSGSRHTRTLSLLSPARDEASGRSLDGALRQLPARKDSLNQANKRSLDGAPHQFTRPPLISQASTTPDLTSEVANTAEPGQTLPDNTDAASTDRDALLRTGRKMASDIKDGLWTFFEDLRQATVGDEATQSLTAHANKPMARKQSTQTLNGKTAKKQASRNSLRPSSRGSTASAETARRPSRSPHACKKHVKSPTLAETSATGLADPSFWAEHGVLAQAGAQQAATAAAKKSSTVRGHKKDVSSAASIKSSSNDESWDTWDEPSPKDSRSSSAASESNTAATTISDLASPRPSEEASRKDPIPWPSLSKLGPANLRRTASHLMNEWEKQLTPSPGQENRGEGHDYLGMGAEAQAISAMDHKKD